MPTLIIGVNYHGTRRPGRVPAGAAGAGADRQDPGTKAKKGGACAPPQVNPFSEENLAFFSS